MKNDRTWLIALRQLVVDTLDREVVSDDEWKG